jgi:hypothetical protein
MNRLEEIRARLEAIRARLTEIEELGEPEGDEATRSATLTARTDETDALLTEWDTLEAERAPLQARSDRLEAVRAASFRPANAEGGDGARVGGRGPEIKRTRDPYEDLELVRSGRYDDGDVIERAKFAIDQAPKYLNDDGRAHAMRLVEMDTEDDSRQAPLIARHMLLTGSRDYRQQYAEYMRTGYAGELLRAALSLTDANGGYLVPFTLDPTIILTNAGIVDPIREMSTVVQIATDTWNGVSSAGVTAGWTAEAGEATDGNTTFGAPSITPKRADSWVTGSYEVLADSGFASQLGRLLADAKARLEGAAFATANTGATRPRGVVAAVAAVTTSIVAAATTNALVIADVYSPVDREQEDPEQDPAVRHHRQRGVLGEPRHGPPQGTPRAADPRVLHHAVGGHHRRPGAPGRRLLDVPDRRPDRHVHPVRAGPHRHHQPPAHRRGRMVRILAGRCRRPRRRRVPAAAAEFDRRRRGAGLT